MYILQAVPPPVLDPVYVVGVLAGVIFALAKFLETRGARKNGNGTFTADDRGRLTHLSKQHNQLDEDGTPIWYVPRSMVKVQGDMLEELRKLNRSVDTFACPYLMKKEGE